MKRSVIVLILTCAVCAAVFAQQSLYVRANGSNANDGLSETTPMKTLREALVRARNQSIKTITIIGTLDMNSEELNQETLTRQAGAFLFSTYGNTPQDITITGKQNANRNERAVLSGKKSGVLAVHVYGIRVHFEYIEISGGEGNGYGILLSEGASVTLGPGAAVRGNASVGLFVNNGTCVIDGGEIQNNKGSAVFIGRNGIATMNDGAIRNNGSPNSEPAVLITNGGVFTMLGGTITANRASGITGGVCVLSGGRFDQTGGTIRNNTTSARSSNPNIFRAEGALGNNL